MAIIRILKWMSSACDDNAIFLTCEILGLDHCSCHNWTSDPHNYYVMQIKEFAKWFNRGNL